MYFFYGKAHKLQLYTTAAKNVSNIPVIMLQNIVIVLTTTQLIVKRKSLGGRGSIFHALSVQVSLQSAQKAMNWDGSGHRRIHLELSFPENHLKWFGLLNVCTPDTLNLDILETLQLSSISSQVASSSNEVWLRPCYRPISVYRSVAMTSEGSRLILFSLRSWFFCNVNGVILLLAEMMAKMANKAQKYACISSQDSYEYKLSIECHIFEVEERISYMALLCKFNFQVGGQYISATCNR